MKRPTYIRDFSLYTLNDPKNWRSSSQMLELGRQYGLTGDTLNFQRRLTNRNGMGPKCQYPLNLIEGKRSTEDARAEATAGMCSTVKKLLEKTGLKPEQIDVLVTTCSVFSPTPSLSSVIIHGLKMKHDIRNFSMEGCGCSPNPAAVEIVQQYLQNPKYNIGLVVSMETQTPIYYTGTDRSMLLLQTLFREGCAATLIVTDPTNCKYKLEKIVRTHTGKINDEAHVCINHTVDKDKVEGVVLAKTIASNADEGLQINVKEMFPNKFSVDEIKKQVDHFCFHTGGISVSVEAVLDLMQQRFNMTDDQMAASRASLWRYGNTSSASIWYELSYFESTSQIKKGQTVWQVTYGSGFKVNTMLLTALKDIDKTSATYFDEFDKDFVFDKSVLEKDLIDNDEEKKFDYDKYEKERKEKNENADVKMLLGKYQNKLEPVSKEESTPKDV